MALRIYNTLSREKEVFEPVHPGRVTMYVCGPTVYDYPHIGHAKTYVSFDAVVRYLRYRGDDVLYVQNITDVGHLTDDAAVDSQGEDKIQKRAELRGVLPMALVETYTREFFKATDNLNCLRPDISPRATGHVPEMIDLIQRLIERGHAYVSEGNVYFDVESDKDYGKLSRRKLEEQEGSGRIEAGAGKRNPADFALWKSAEGTRHSMRWNSPWGVGFPGWHIECSAMAMKYLGETIDLHGAGVDNIFPHNEDEIAQSECATERPFVRYWMHNGTVMVNGEKMAKSKGNFVTVEKGIEQFGATVLRFWLLTHHYRSPVDYTLESVGEATKGVARLRNALENAERYLAFPPGADDGAAAAKLREETDLHRARFSEAMDDDFNTPVAISVLYSLASEINRLTATAASQSTEGAASLTEAVALFHELAGVLGLVLTDEVAASDNDVVDPLVHLLLEARASLRKHRDFSQADQIRNRLAELGFQVEDRSDGSTYKRG